MNKLEGATIRALIRDNMPKFPKLLSKIAGNAISEGLNFKIFPGRRPWTPPPLVSGTFIITHTVASYMSFKIPSQNSSGNLGT